MTDDRLRARAERGAVRGPDRVWATALRGRTERHSGPGRSWWVPLAVAAGVVSIVAGATFGFQQRGMGENDLAATAATTAPPTAAPTISPSATASHVAPTPGSSASQPQQEEPTGVHRAPDLDRPYLACVQELGVPLGFAEVIAEGSGRAVFAKTDVDVPAAVHRPCLIRIGGNDPRSSSYGYQNSS